jgi:hypothetical protein
MVTRRVDSTLLLRQGADNPSDDEWDTCLRLLAEALQHHRRVNVLVRTDGGGPSPSQRQKLQALTKKGDVWVSVVSESVKVRFIVSSVALLQTRIQSFRVHELSAAFDHLGISPASRAPLERNLAEMTELVR